MTWAVYSKPSKSTKAELDGRLRVLTRCLELARTLEELGKEDGYEFSVVELGEAFGVNKRTVYRDLHALKLAGYPLEIRGGWRTATVRYKREAQ